MNARIRRLLPFVKGQNSATRPVVQDPEPQVNALPQSGGVGAGSLQVGGNVSFRAFQEEGFIHPWQVSSQYVDRVPGAISAQGKPQGKWTINILPGFVNGIDPLAYGLRATGRSPYEKITASGLGSVGGANYERTTVNTAPLLDSDEPGWYGLARGPVIPINGYPVQQLPEFFKRMGATNPTKPPSNFSIDLNILKITIDATPGNEPSRYVVGCDFFLGMTRASVQTRVDIIGNVLLGQLVEYSSVLAGGSERPKVYQGDYQEFRARMSPTGFEALATRLQGGSTDADMDTLPLFTVWMLSPAFGGDTGRTDVQVGTEPNGDWVPFVQYQTFWNVFNRQKNEQPFNANFSPTIDPGTAAFVGRYTFAAGTVGALGAEIDRIMNGLMNQTNEGRTWTA